MIKRGVLAPMALFICLAPLSLPAAITLLVCVPLIPLSIVAVQRIAKRVMGSYWDTYTDLDAMFLESIQGLSTLKVFKADETRHEKLNSEAETFRRATMRLLVMQLNSITVMDLFAFGGATLGIIIALSQLASGAATFAAVFTMIFLSAEFFLPLRALGSLFHTAISGMAASDKMFALLDTPLGDLGDSLSGGERQRLGLARVFLHDAPFILLDEPTSNLDSLNEAAVLSALSANREGKTIVLVSHRPSAAAIADSTYSVERLTRAS